jgi:hypothetical protein
VAFTNVNQAGTAGDQWTGRHAAKRGSAMIKLLLAVIALIIAAMIAGAYFGFNPVILIFAILGFGVCMVGRIGGPALPKGSYISPASHGVYMRGRDYVQDDGSPDGEDPRQGDGFR